MKLASGLSAALAALSLCTNGDVLAQVIFEDSFESRVVIIHDEQLSGDIELDLATMNPKFNFEVGANMVSGTMSNNMGGTTDFDGFYFFMPEGASLTSVKFEYFNLNVLPETTSLGVAFRIVGQPEETNPDRCFTNHVSILDAPKSILVNVCDNTDVSTIDFPVPQNPEGYRWSQGLLRSPTGAGGTWGYRWTFNVE